MALQIVHPDRPVPYTPLPLTVLREQSQQREDEEALRKLYVALTRARDYLIVVLTDVPQNPWCRGLRGALADLSQPQRQRDPPAERGRGIAHPEGLGRMPNGDTHAN
ncbi:MAG: hypothetical protein KatS3mg016_1943 [Fimbriimonadales bacterium]|nr:MAG: hypothetical protein KatS3mg016_1943 [Fimbriimonadales bacterium]